MVVGWVKRWWLDGVECWYCTVCGMLVLRIVHVLLVAVDGRASSGRGRLLMYLNCKIETCILCMLCAGKTVGA